ncbi:orotidine-5'-phosphate decarboxylase [Lentilactobacillus kribbianus]|uniref:orotidine-5'-phosphate decarboxylase n=1 Tax=Lentilactobacillus kribbianus TaxID=2729622 RepID=UPI001551C180|nr:orotidine-5'-phosphate decarboxylase [Lentilactobacillus kribbianus]
MGPLIISLDVAQRADLFQLIDQFDANETLTVKIGMGMFYGEGPQIVRDLLNMGHHIFLDLKLHDIPNTVENGMRQIGRLGVTYTTVHALGGAQMIAQAKRGLLSGAQDAGVAPARLLAVTELTSITPQELQAEQNCRLDMADQVVSLAQLAKKAGADGVITSPLEVPTLQKQVGKDFLYVTPGIRPHGAPQDDQARTATPREAALKGSNALVIGRPIIQAANPVNTYHQLLEEWENAER